MVLLTLLRRRHTYNQGDNEYNYQDNNDNNNNDPHPSIQTRFLNEVEVNITAVRSLTICASDGIVEHCDLVVSAVDSSRLRIEGNASRKLRSDETTILSTPHNRSEAEVRLLLDGEILAVVLDSVDGHRITVVLNLDQLALAAQSLILALVVLLTVLVGVVSFNSASVAILSWLTGGLESLGVHAQFGKLEAIATLNGAVRRRLHGVGVGTLGSLESVHVVDL